jgi:hypothetical protein
VVLKPGPHVVRKYLEAFNRELNAASMDLLKTSMQRMIREKIEASEAAKPEDSFIAETTEEKKPELVTPDVLNEADRRGEFDENETISNAPYKINGTTLH